MGPILFCMVVNDLAPVCQNSIFIKYADDLTILNLFQDSNDDNLQAEVSHVTEWCKTKGLDMNLSKCYVMNVITKKSLSCRPISITDDFFMTDANHLKILGCYFSHDMKWDKHVEMCIKNASRKVYLILSLKRAGCSSKMLFYVYSTCIRPILLYCFPTMCNMPQFLRRKLLSVEKRIYRIIACDEELPSLFCVADAMCERIFKQVESNLHVQHPLRDFFDNRLYKKRNKCPLRRPRTKTKRFCNTFIKYCK